MISHDGTPMFYSSAVRDEAGSILVEEDSPAITVAEIINKNLDNFTKSERRVALALLANYPMAALETIVLFARKSEASPPTVLRFISRIGFGGYADFQKALRVELNDQLKSPLMKLASGSSEANRVSKPQFRDFMKSLVNNLEGTLNHLSSRELDGVIDLLANRKANIYLYGGRFTDAIAQYMAAHLRVLRPGVIHLGGQSESLRDQLLSFRKGDVLVVFDVRRYQASLVEFSGQAASYGVKVVLVTDQWMSPAARHASHMLTVRIEAPSIWDSNVATLALVELLLASLTTKLWPTAKKRIGQIESLRAQIPPP